MNFAKLPDGRYINLDEVIIIGIKNECCDVNFDGVSGARYCCRFESSKAAREWIRKNTTDRDQVIHGVDMATGASRLAINALQASKNSKEEKGKDGE